MWNPHRKIRPRSRPRSLCHTSFINICRLRWLRFMCCTYCGTFIHCDVLFLWDNQISISKEDIYCRWSVSKLCLRLGNWDLHHDGISQNAGFSQFSCCVVVWVIHSVWSCFSPSHSLMQRRHAEHQTLMAVATRWNGRLRFCAEWSYPFLTNYTW